MSEKNCPVCENVKPLSEFSKNKSRSDGYNSMCKLCMNAYYKANSAKILKQQKDNYQRNRESILAKKRTPEYRKKVLPSARANREKHKDKLNARRVDRFKNDPKYRAKAIARGTAALKANPEIGRQAARLRYNEKRGYIIKPDNCELCGVGGRLVAHHESYCNPPEPIYLCSSCQAYYHTGTLEKAHKVRVKVKQLHQDKYGFDPKRPFIKETK